MSKIGFHISAGNQQGLGEALKKCAEAGSPLAAIFSVDQNVWPDIERFSPQTTSIFRTKKNAQGQTIGDGPGDVYHGDPVLSARTWMAQMMPVWAKNKAHFYAPLNEQDPAQIEGFTWLNTFSIECMSIAEQNGYELALYGFSGGNPKDVLQPAVGRPFTRDDAWRELVPSLQRAKVRGHILILHEYGFNFGTLRNSRPWLALRYRHAYRYLKTQNADAPLVIAEASAGVGFAGIDPQTWLDDVRWYDGEIMKDRAMIGCCLYQLGGSENFVTLVPQLADYAARTPSLPSGAQFDPVAPAPDVDAGNNPVPDDLIFLTDRPPEIEEYRVVCNVLRVRSLPSTSATIIKALTKGNVFAVTSKTSADGYEWGKSSDGWVALREIVEPLTEKVA